MSRGAAIPGEPLYAWVKRGMDVGVAATLLVALSPVLAVAALLVRWRLGSPVLFRQSRAGRHEVPFVLTKFRTMLDATAADGSPLPDSARLTPFGRWLRRTSIDELPSLVNVLRGDMSLVGPRPLPLAYLALYSDEQRLRHEVPPGLTGWAQIHGRNAVDWDERFALDAWYVRHRSLALDLRILVRTAGLVVSARGVSAPGEATMRVFTGSARHANHK